MGGIIQDKFGWKVNLTDFDIEVGMISDSLVPFLIDCLSAIVGYQYFDMNHITLLACSSNVSTYLQESIVEKNHQ